MLNGELMKELATVFFFLLENRRSGNGTLSPMKVSIHVNKFSVVCYCRVLEGNQLQHHDVSCQWY